MRFVDDRNHLRIEIDTKDCSIPEDERARMQTMLAPLGEVVHDFPASELWINVVNHPATQAYHIAFKMKVPGLTLFTSERDPYLDSALERGLRKLVRKVEDYKERPDRRAEELAQQRTALEREVMAPQDPQTGPLAAAVRQGDYRAFRTALATYEEWLRKRVGRWVQRYPQAQAQVGDGLLLGDLVEEVYLNAFERFAGRPTDVRLSQWLDGLIDPSLRALLRHPDEERQNASMARTVREHL
jgi:ribosome-associated translation inhibitor RaiA